MSAIHFLMFTVLPGLTLLLGIGYAVYRSIGHRDGWLVLSSLVLLFMCAHQFLEAFEVWRLGRYGIDVPREIFETVVNVGGTFVILLLANSRYRYQEAREELVEAKEDLEAEKERCEERSEQLERALDAKKTLLEEINHRVKNNLQTVESLIRLEANRAPDVAGKLEELASRVRTMALLHEQLHEPSGTEEVSSGQYFVRLVEEAVRSHAADPQSVDTELSIDVPDLELSKAVPCGLVVNELISNAFEHGIKGRTGILEVEFRRSNAGYRLRVTDSGGGVGGDFESLIGDSLGLKLVKNLVEHELDGTVHVDSNDRTSFHVEFPRS